MGRTRRKTILRGILSNKRRFLSIFLIVALGTGFLAGLMAASPDMYETADRYMDRCGMFDLEIRSPLGFSEENVKTLASLEGVETVQASKTVDLILDGEEQDSYTARIYGRRKDDPLNRFVLLSGREPERADECVLQITSGRYAKDTIREGTVLTVSEENETNPFLSTASDTLKVVGFVETPFCMGVEPDSTGIGSGSIGLHVFVPDSFFDTEEDNVVYLTVSGAKEKDSFSEAYKELVSRVQKNAEQAEETCLRERKEELASVNMLLAAAEGVIEQKNELNEDEQVRKEQSLQVIDSLREKGESPLLSMLEHEAALSGNADGSRESEERIKGVRKLFDSACFFYRTRGDMAAEASYDSNVGKVAALSKVFPVFFFAVALLVALTTISRMVEENRTTIGTMKALGVSDENILAEYLIFASVCCVPGCILGLAAGFRLFPSVIGNAYRMMYTLPKMETPFRWGIAAFVSPVTVLGIFAAALFSCISECRAVPARLLIAKAPPAGKRILLEKIPFLWKRLSFNGKVTMRNLFRYKQRFYMTVIGVAGCSALLVTGFGLKDSINDIVEVQFGELYRYDFTVAADEEAYLDRLGTQNGIEKSLKVFAANAKVKKERKKEEVTLMIPQDTEELSDFLLLRERKGRRPLTLSDPGETGSVILTEKLCELLKVSAGDTVELTNADGRRAEFTVSGIAENYLSSFAYMTERTYREAFGEEPAYSLLWCLKEEEAVEEEVITKLLSDPHCLSVRSNAGLMDSFADSIKSIDAVVAVLILAAGLLSVVVLYNLINVNVCERRKELATIRVLGFYEREVYRYIFREIYALSFLGTLAGLAVGSILHRFVVKTVEVNGVMFGRRIYGPSYLKAFVISLGFTVLVNRLCRSQINKVDMVEAMKAGE